MPDERYPDELGALWQRTTKDGETYFTGTVGGEKIVVFRNRKKTSDNQPDYRILKSRPRE